MRKTLLALGVVAAVSGQTFAADYSDDIHKNDGKFINFNLMHAIDEKPGNTEHTYLEMEFGGRSGMFDLYGYVDVFNLSDDDDSEKSGQDRLFAKFAPRLSLDALTGSDLSFGPVQELYIANYTVIDGGAKYSIETSKKDSDGNYVMAEKDPGFQSMIGLGSDVMVPWFGKMQFNLYANYDVKQNDWNGYQFSTNWFKPFFFFENGSFITYQGYLDYQFGMKDEYSTSSTGGSMFNGIYWHNKQFAVGYGLKLYDNVYGIKDSDAFESSGVGHYFAVTYKF
ncbi:outer membrane protein OmpK [Vibrio renipiscarius]|uniref:Membrane protein n=1 Tax=Vibrio renipiscarius TaxID=1461322 RepID=A0A0C2KJ52_9VIBR|nr:outer membrane protein OmpK [Vibrio renipiscarius]KII80356.1 membrane protein [Vibrio renipiscarius]KII82383.1 membrane protein [Vibrio renipiscarius]